MAKAKFILIDVPWNYGYGRQVLRGIYKFSRPDRPWLFTDIQYFKNGGEGLEYAGTVGVITIRNTEDYAKFARRRRQAVVSVSEQVPGIKSPRVRHAGVNLKALGEMAAEYFIERGFRNFGAVASDKIGLPILFHSHYRGEAFAAALRRRKLTCDIFDPEKEYLQPDEPLPPISNNRVFEHAHRWLMGLDKPLAVFCFDDYAGQCICELCRRSEVKVPEEVAILGVDDDVFCDMAYPHLSSIQVPAEQVGYEAARLIDALLCRQNPPQRPVLLPPVAVITRQSTDVMAIDDIRIVEAIRYIRENAHKGIRVENVIEKVSLPRRTLEYRFHKTLGRGPFAEIRRVQIEHVKTLLAQTNKTLEAIAPECGFESVTRMTLAFKKADGVPPGAYRKQFRSR
jgi:LacI family transcriptional regulator